MTKPRQSSSPAADKAARALCAKFIGLFGAELGPIYFVNGLSVDEAREAFRSRPAYAEVLADFAIDAGLGLLAALAVQNAECFARGIRHIA